MDEFEYLDVVLLVSGCKVFRANFGIRVLNLIMFLLIVICYVSTLFKSIENQLTKGGLVMVGMMERYSHEVCGLTFIAVLSYHRTRIRGLLSFAANNLTAKQKSSLKKHASFCLLMTFLTLAQEVAFTHYHLRRNREKFDSKHKVMDWLECYHQMNSWFFGGCAVYTFFVKVIRFHEINYFNSIEGRTDILIPSADAKLALERRSVSLFKQDLIKTFAFIPCLWIIHAFIEAPVVVLEVAQPDSDFMEQMWSILPFLYELTSIAYVVYLCDLCTCTVASRSEDLLIFLLRENRMEDMPLFARQLESAASHEFTSWRTITMNRKFYLGFLCSIVSFTVLSVQVTQKMTGVEKDTIPVIPARF